uniref:Uncharacterized protein n=1 Tax=Arundo donax TaxID=35708 RepID=A0A0A8Z1L0_ARUDO
MMCTGWCIRFYVEELVWYYGLQLVYLLELVYGGTSALFGLQVASSRRYESNFLNTVGRMWCSVVISRVIIRDVCASMMTIWRSV